MQLNFSHIRIRLNEFHLMYKISQNRSATIIFSDRSVPAKIIFDHRESKSFKRVDLVKIEEDLQKSSSPTESHLKRSFL